MKMSHLYGGIAGGVVFGLIGGLLLGSCVFRAGPNHQTVSAERPGKAGGSMAGSSPDMAGMEGGPSGAPAGSTPGGMDPGSSTMEAVFARVGKLKSAIEKDPRDRGALIELANLYYDAGKFDQAIGYYEKAITLDDNDPNLITDTANCYWQTGNAVKALDMFKDVQRRFPEHWQSAANLFFLAASLGDAALAHDALEKVRRLKPAFDKLPAMDTLYQNMKTGASPSSGT